MVAARRAVGLERELGVVVRVRVDDARRHDAAGGIDHSIPLAALDEADGRDLAVLDCHVRGAAREARAIDDGAVGDDEVVAGHDPETRTRSSVSSAVTSPAGHGRL